MWDGEPWTLDLSDVVRLSDDDLLRLSAANPDLDIEQNAAGQLEIMAPAGYESSVRCMAIAAALYAWNEMTGLGVVSDSSGGFKLPNGAIRAPDAAWVALEDFENIEAELRDGFLPAVPRFLVEVRSRRDHLPTLQRKMVEWMENGCRLAWLVDPFDEKVFVYRAGDAVESLPFEGELSGEDVLPGFSFDVGTLS